MEIKYLQVVQMPNGELIHQGKTVGWIKECAKYLVDSPVKMFECEDCHQNCKWSFNDALDAGMLIPICENGHEMKIIN